MLNETEGGLLGLTINKAFIELSLSFSNSYNGYCQVCVPSVVVSVAFIGTISKSYLGKTGISR